MNFRIGLENNVEGRSLTWVLDHPGCFAYGRDGQEALDNTPATIRAYRDWITAHASSWLTLDRIELEVEETWEVYTIGDDYEPSETGYEVNAWFRHDWKPLGNEEIERGLELLGWSHTDFLGSVQGLSDGEMHISLPGERWDIAGVLRHVGGAEWWYLDRLGLAFPRQDVPEKPFERLDAVRAHLVGILPGLEGSTQVVGIDGEVWSPRKVLRRALWHERDHTQHILKLRSLISG